MTHQQMWQEFSRETGIDEPYEAWAFGADADELARLVLEGKKTATAGLYIWYERENVQLPKEGSYSIVLNSKDDAICVVQTTKVTTVPFCKVSKEHAWKEGEGDRSLAYWRRIHEDFFSGELSAAGIWFDDRMCVVCEEFLRLYP